MSRARPAAAVGVLVLCSGLLAACTDDESEPTPAGTAPTSTATGSPTTSLPSPGPSAGGPSVPVPDDLAIAESSPREDSYYPQVGEPGVDALHYHLDLAWDPDHLALYGTETLTFRATEDAGHIQLDFGEPLQVLSAEVDGAAAEATKDGKDLRITGEFHGDETYTLVLRYTGTPEPVRAPTTRSDLLHTGFTVDDQRQVWTMQEPFGAFTWYAVNDQPSDKALYDFTLRVASPWTGIANGEQVTDRDDGTAHITRYHLAEPAASYLITVAFGDYDKTEDTGPNGLPITYWTPRGVSRFDQGLHTTPDAIAWLEQLLGPYPFDTAGIVVVDSESGMETQTMVTLGNTSYATSPATIVHEMAHQWYGDRVTPNDWRDVWMNEGMAMYLQLMWEAEQAGVEFTDYLADYRGLERQYRADAGPPGSFDPSEFGSSNIYFGGAFLWQAVRERIGDEDFFHIIRAWPESQDNRSTDRETLLEFVETESGEDLDELWDAWLLGRTTPPGR